MRINAFQKIFCSEADLKNDPLVQLFFPAGVKVCSKKDFGKILFENNEANKEDLIKAFSNRIRRGINKNWNNPENHSQELDETVMRVAGKFFEELEKRFWHERETTHEKTPFMSAVIKDAIHICKMTAEEAVKMSRADSDDVRRFLQRVEKLNRCITENGILGTQEAGSVTREKIAQKQKALDSKTPAIDKTTQLFINLINRLPAESEDEKTRLMALLAPASGIRIGETQAPNELYNNQSPHRDATLEAFFRCLHHASQDEKMNGDEVRIIRKFGEDLAKRLTANSEGLFAQSDTMKTIVNCYLATVRNCFGKITSISTYKHFLEEEAKLYAIMKDTGIVPDEFKTLGEEIEDKRRETDEIIKKDNQDSLEKIQEMFPKLSLEDVPLKLTNIDAKLLHHHIKNATEGANSDYVTDVEAHGQKLRLARCPRSNEEAARYLQESLEKGTKVFISLLETCEGPKRGSVMFWLRESLQEYLPPSWRVSSFEEKVLAEGTCLNQKQELPSIIERSIVLTNDRGEEIPFTHLHYDRWVDHYPAPDEQLLTTLLDRATELSPNGEHPFAINCQAGLGRTGIVGVYAACRKKIDSMNTNEDGQAQLFDIAGTIYQLRSQRKSFGGSPDQMQQTLSVTAKYAKNVLDMAKIQS